MLMGEPTPARNWNVPREFQEWLNTRALTVVPVAAAELVGRSVTTRLERDSLRRQLHELIKRESDTPWGDLLALRNHEADALRDVHEKSEALIAVLQRGGKGEDEHRAWRQAVGRYERRSA